MDRNAAIVVTGGRGLVGSALLRHMTDLGYKRAVGSVGDLTQPTDFSGAAYVFHCAAFVRGILGNMEAQAESCRTNTLINLNVIDACRRAKVKKVVAMGTVAMYPDLDAYPAREEQIWEGPPHPAERGYAHAKRHMLALLDAYRESYGLPYACAIATNLYGPGDRFDTRGGHVLPSLVRKFHESDRVEVWGDGSACRDFLHVDDAARGLLALMDHVEGPANLASGVTHSIREVVDVLTEHTVGRQIVWDRTKPVGQATRSYDISRIWATGWRPQVALADGLRRTYDWYAANHAVARAA